MTFRAKRRIVFEMIQNIELIYAHLYEDSFLEAFKNIFVWLSKNIFLS